MKSDQSTIYSNLGSTPPLQEWIVKQNMWCLFKMLIILFPLLVLGSFHDVPCSSSFGNTLPKTTVTLHLWKWMLKQKKRLSFWFSAYFQARTVSVFGKGRPLSPPTFSQCRTCSDAGALLAKFNERLDVVLFAYYNKTHLDFKRVLLNLYIYNLYITVCFMFMVYYTLPCFCLLGYTQQKTETI